MFNNDFGTNLKCFYQTQLSAIHFSSMSAILDIIIFEYVAFGQQFCYENKIRKLHVYTNIIYLTRFDFDLHSVLIRTKNSSSSTRTRGQANVSSSVLYLVRQLLML